MGMLQSQKTSVRWEGAYGSPGTFPIMPVLQNPLAFRHIPSPLVYSEFGGYGGPEKRSMRRYKQGWGTELAYQSLLSLLAHLGLKKHDIGAQNER